jgi:hypothetical protein
MVQAQFQKFSQPRNTSQGVLSSEYALRDNENGKKFSGEPEEFTFRRQLKCSGDINLRLC